MRRGSVESGHVGRQTVDCADSQRRPVEGQKVARNQAQPGDRSLSRAGGVRPQCDVVDRPGVYRRVDNDLIAQSLGLEIDVTGTRHGDPDSAMADRQRTGRVGDADRTGRIGREKERTRIGDEHAASAGSSRVKVAHCGANRHHRCSDSSARECQIACGNAGSGN